MTLFALREVGKRYPDGMRESLVLDRVSLEIDTGETVGVLAARRAGKTTLLRIAAGLDVPDEGEVCWEYCDLARMSTDERARLRRRRGIALASGDWHPLASVSVLEHVAMPLYSDGLRMNDAEVCARRALERVQAPRLGYQATDRLGLVDRLHVELARALVGEPRLLLMDEPAVLPRPEEARKFYELLHALPRQLDLALLIVSEEVAAVRGASRMMNLDGKLYSTDSRRKVVNFPGRRGNDPGREPEAS
jgi:predicted ABC-type transport system involved in lysophospholipase L1 biosynthesis ATPase subunit